MTDGTDIRDYGSVISAALGMIAGGESLDADMSSLISEISRYEGPEVLGDDEFAAKFLDAVYHRKVREGKGTSPAAQAVKGLGTGRDGSPSIGTTAKGHGTYVTDTVNALVTMDLDNGSDIAAIGKQA